MKTQVEETCYVMLLVFCLFIVIYSVYKGTVQNNLTERHIKLLETQVELLKQEKALRLEGVL